jgi:hypothetical protein
LASLARSFPTPPPRTKVVSSPPELKAVVTTHHRPRRRHRSRPRMSLRPGISAHDVAAGRSLLSLKPWIKLTHTNWGEEEDELRDEHARGFVRCTAYRFSVLSIPFYLRIQSMPWRSATPRLNRAIPRLERAHGDPTESVRIVLANDSVLEAN